MAVDKQRKNNAGGVTGKGFRPGKSGNPNGRPKGRCVSDWIRAKLAEKGDDGRTRAEAMADLMLEQALDGHFQFAKELLDRAEGKVPDVLRTDEAGRTKDDDIPRLVALAATLRDRARKAGAGGDLEPGDPGRAGDHGDPGPMEDGPPPGPAQ